MPGQRMEDGKPYYEIELKIKPADADQFIIQRCRLVQSGRIGLYL